MLTHSDSLQLDEFVEQRNVGVLDVLEPWQLLLKVLGEVEQLLRALDELLLFDGGLVDDVLQD